jgi:MYXO-CTERM domain-containing protein
VLRSADAEFAPTKTVQLVVNAVNMPPELPVQVSPIDDAVVATGDTPLVWTNADDPEGAAVSYDVELYADDTTALPVQTATAVAGDASGTTSWTPTALPENTRAFWRIRSRDAGAALSTWTDYEGYLVDAANDPPDVPVLIKPAEGELLTVRRPALSALNVEDPEADAVELIFEIARDADFTVVVWTSIVVPQNELSATTMTTMDEDLDWGFEYYARVMAQDVRGGISEWSEPHRFELKENYVPGTPTLTCTATTYDVEPPTEVVVGNVEDPEGEVVTFELEMFAFDDDPSSADPVYTTSVEMDGSMPTTTIPIDLTDVPNGRYRYRVRAFDGTDPSGWVECELTLALPEMEMGSPDGGCCSTGSSPAGAAVLALFALLALRRRRR